MPADDAGPRERGDANETPDAPRVERSRPVGAPPPAVWRVLTDRASRRHVLGGDLDVDLVEGAEGTWRPVDGPELPVRVRRVDEHRHLVFDWGADEDTSTVDIRLRPSQTGTDIRVVEVRRPSGASPRPGEASALCLAA